MRRALALTLSALLGAGCTLAEPPPLPPAHPARPDAPGSPPEALATALLREEPLLTPLPAPAPHVHHHHAPPKDADR